MLAISNPSSEFGKHPYNGSGKNSLLSDVSKGLRRAQTSSGERVGRGCEGRKPPSSIVSGECCEGRKPPIPRSFWSIQPEPALAVRGVCAFREML